MRKAGLIILIGSMVLTVVFLGIWIAGLFLAETFGGLIHVFFLLAFVTAIGIVAGGILLIISLVQKK